MIAGSHNGRISLRGIFCMCCHTVRTSESLAGVIGNSSEDKREDCLVQLIRTLDTLRTVCHTVSDAVEGGYVLAS